jgi:TolB-like protein/Flp pilus assembly protein TadD
MPDLLDRLRTALAERYTIEREIGAGGMATVYLATDLKHRRPVAITVLKPELAQAIGPDRFLREIEVTAGLHHPHILPLYDSGRTGGPTKGPEADEPAESPAIGHRRSAEFLHYVMPYVEGESLRDRLDREHQLPLEEALQLAREVADALIYAHSHGVIHRDIKPENILLESGHALVADFGIAKAVTEAGGERLTGTGVSIGTPAYMSPEQASGAAQLDSRSDLYSLGCVLYEMLSGETPYTGPTPQAILAKKLSEPLPRISVVREAVPASVEAALEKALARVPADRFATAAAFAEAIGPRVLEAIPARRGAGRPASTRRARTRTTLLAIAAVVVVTIALGLWLRPGAPGSRRPRTAIAVLPIENLSGDASNAYLAGGLHDELITQLAKVAALSVRGRTSVMRYAGTTKPIRQIGAELGVGTVVEASLQVAGERLRVHVQLIDAATDTHLWAERYDRTLDDAFAIESDVAQRIVAAVGATLGEAEAGALAAAPTADPEAYRLYLRALEYRHRPGYQRRNFEIAQQLLEQAVTLDSTFALAYASLSELHALTFQFRYDPSPARLDLQVAAAERALRLAPRLPQVHIALGTGLFARGDARAALQEYRTALEGLPNDARLWARVGYMQRALGHWDEALQTFDRVATLDPLNPNPFLNLCGMTRQFLHRYREAIECYRRAAALAPDFAVSDVQRGWTWVLWRGRLDSLKAALDRHPPDASDPGTGSIRWYRGLTLLLERQPDSLLALMRGAPYSIFEGETTYMPTALYVAWARRQRGDGAAARVAFEASLALLDSALARLPDDWRVHASRGMALAGLGRSQEALEEARWLQQSRAYREGAYSYGLERVEARARILVPIGEPDAALGEIERLLAGPSWISGEVFRLDPRFDPIRGDARFQALLAKYADAEPVR